MSRTENRSWLLAMTLIAPLLVVGPASTAAGQTVTNEQAWFVFVAQERPRSNSPWQWSGDVVFRTRDGVRTFDVFAFRPTVLYRLTSRSMIGGGYLQARSYPSSGNTVVEQRVFGQYNWSRPARGGTLALRTRVEARFIDGNGGGVTRLRQQVKFSHPVRPHARVSLVGYEELLVHANGATRTARGVDQNRVFGGVGLPLTTASRLEVGYLLHFAPGHGKPNRLNHVLSASLSVQF
jgi:hypothetical protein